jgi:hypothetical protein
MPTATADSFAVDNLSVGDDPDKRLPMAATCFFKLKLPPYTTKEALADRLTCALALTELGLPSPRDARTVMTAHALRLQMQFITHPQWNSAERMQHS